MKNADEWMVVGRKGRPTPARVFETSRRCPSAHSQELHADHKHHNSGTKDINRNQLWQVFTSNEATSSDNGKRHKRLMYKLEKAKRELSKSSMLSGFLECWEALPRWWNSVQKMVLYGLGSPEQSLVSRYQAWLYERLLAANWSPDNLALMVIIGNSFEHYCCRWQCAPVPKGYDRPARLIALSSAGVVAEVPVVEMDMESSSAFNDTSIHTFPPDRLQSTSLFSQGAELQC